MQHAFKFEDKPNHRAKNNRLGFQSKKTLRRSDKTATMGHVFVQAPESLVARNEALLKAQLPPASEARSVAHQRQSNKKRLLRKEADRHAEEEKLNEFLFAGSDEEEQIVTVPLTRNAKNECKLSEALAASTPSEAKQLIRGLRVVATNGGKVHFRPKNVEQKKDIKRSKNSGKNPSRVEQ